LGGRLETGLPGRHQTGLGGRHATGLPGRLRPDFAKTKLLKLSRSSLKYLGLDCKQSLAPKKGLDFFTRPLKKWEFVEALFYAEFFGHQKAIYSQAHSFSVKRVSRGTRAHVATLNSRLGSLKHTKSFGFRKKALMKFWDGLYEEKKEFLYFSEDFTSVKLIKKQ